MSDIEFSLVQISVMHGLKQGNEVLKQIHKEMNPESVEMLLEETAEARAYQRVNLLLHPTITELTIAIKEIDDMLANSLTLDEEEAVQAELLRLQEEAVRHLAFVKLYNSQTFLNLYIFIGSRNPRRSEDDTGNAICSYSCAIGANSGGRSGRTQGTAAKGCLGGLIEIYTLYSYLAFASFLEFPISGYILKQQW